MLSLVLTHHYLLINIESQPHAATLLASATPDEPSSPANALAYEELHGPWHVCPFFNVLPDASMHKRNS